MHVSQTKFYIPLFGVIVVKRLLVYLPIGEKGTVIIWTPEVIAAAPALAGGARARQRCEQG
jgi:hypothetical protein